MSGAASSGGCTFDEVLSELQHGLASAADKPDETAESTAAALWFAAAGKPCSVSRAQPPLPKLGSAQCQNLLELVRRRLQGEPLAYLTGVQEFLDLDFIAAPGALIPRRETELLGRACLGVLQELTDVEAAIDVLDLCTGCGNLAIAMALQAGQARVYATDLESEALGVAALNLERHGLTKRVTLLQGDLFGALQQPGKSEDARRFALISCNPPYLATKHATHMPVAVAGSEPIAAFDGGPFGLSIVMRLLREAPNHLRPGGWLCFEIGAGQQPIVDSRVAQNAGYTEIRRIRDQQGVVRAFQLLWKPAADTLITP